MGDSSPELKKMKQVSDMKAFDDIFPELVQLMTKDGLKDSEVADAMTWHKEVLEYNCPYGKKNRGLTVVHSYQYLVGDKATEEDLKLARILGWCVEFLQAFFLVADDIMDASVTRRGQPCWYKLEKVGLIATNDSIYIENTIYVILKKYFKSKPYYVELIELMHEVTLQTITGQTLDLITAPTDHIDFSNYTIERYNAIVKYKTAFYSFYLPVALAMHMAGIEDEAAFDSARVILLKMGEFFQIQDDYIDCFGDPTLTGKVGTDIEDNKCGWLIVQALTRVSAEQRQVLEENYAKKDAECVAKVKAVYKELKLQRVYADYEENSYNELIQLIDQLDVSLPRKMFTAYADKIYKRDR
ncbi:hypothetical protein NP493_144g03004 [Ridgeia piscesae]|uniref:Farnesyl pyrophosphate synthase n=1 Tax=Ridgeia piscesae TaxID=27915 RepID=A0AAD9UG51_RIDPI|nr:hypothetical protein NP493_144g03004 [Ridgeia piscesae]